MFEKLDNLLKKLNEEYIIVEIHQNPLLLSC
jgi:hypothetical protein